MPPDPPPPLTTVRTATTTRWILPPHRTIHPLHPHWPDRLASWFLLAIGIVVTGTACDMGVALIRNISTLFPLDLVNALLLTVMILGLFVVATMFVVATVVTLYAFPEHYEITLNHDTIVITSFTGVFHFSKRHSRTNLTGLIIQSPRTMTRNMLNLPFDQRPAALLLEYAAPHKSAILLMAFPRTLITQLASALTEAILPASPLTLLDTTNPSYLNADDALPPPSCNYQLHTHPDGIEFTPTPTRKTITSLLLSPSARAVTWGLLLALLSFVALSLFRLPLQPGTHLMFLPFAAILAVLLVVEALLLNVHYSIRLTPEALMRTSPFFPRHRSHNIPRSQITAVQIVIRLGNKDRVRTVLEITTPNQKTLNFHTDNLPTLRFIATHLRHALHLQAPAPESPQPTPP